ncbi:MAG: class I SAM-dependent methyltransferase [Myxococcales bacterium]|nr:class I SAM-dependent methyltransferase [Myxococcales bacterium]
MESQLYRDLARLEDTHWWSTSRRTIVREVLTRKLPPASQRRILDAGCGTGGMLSMLRELGEAEGLDSSQEALTLARQRLGPAVPLTLGQLPDGLPAGRNFELITAFDVLEHIPDAVGALAAIRGSLTVGGILACTVPTYQFLWSRHDEVNHHCRRYTARMLAEQLDAAGMRLTWYSYFNSLLFPPIAAVRLMQRLVLPANGGSDFNELPPALNQALTTIFSAERLILPHLRLPFGVSLLALAEAR